MPVRPERIEELFRRTARRRPDAVAAVHGADRLTYRALERRADAMARALSGRVGPGQLVAVQSAKTLDTVTCTLACLIAGIPYVPVDASLPAARRAAILDGAGCGVLAYDATASGARGAPATGEARTPVVELAELADAGPGAASGTERDRSDTAYVLFTSGSTGTPKGVVTTHGNLVSALDWIVPFMGLREDDRVLCHAPLHFDMYPLDAYGAWAVGATVVLADDRTIVFPRAVAGLVRDQGITHVLAVPAAWIGILRLESEAPATGSSDDPLRSLRTIAYSGEEFPVRWLRQLATRCPEARIVNIYGLVETNAVVGVEVTAEHLARERVPIGYALGPNRVVLLGDGRRPVTAPGVEGEIVVHGPSVSRAYLNDPATTAAAWVDIEDGPGVRYYRTGDFGAWDDTGALHFRGRRDARVKSRGFRIELGDVEAAFMTCPGVDFAVAVPRAHADFTNELVLFVEATDSSVTRDDLFVWGRRLLAPYMVPREIEVTTALPRTATGKADRQALLRLVSA